MNLLEALVNAIRLPELRNKILFTGGILIVFRLFANIAIPEANKTALGLLFNQQALLGLLDLFSGGGLSRFSVVAMGMNPYINATIIMQLMTVISERIKEIQKEGEMGRRRIQRWSRYLTVALGAGQAYGFTVLFQNTNPAILGPLAETSFMTTMISFSNDWTVFFTRPVSGTIMVLVALALVYPTISDRMAQRRRSHGPSRAQCR